MRILHWSAVGSALLASIGCTSEKSPSTNHAAGESHATATMAATPCRDPAQWEVRDSAIGPIRIGAAADSVVRLCPGTRDSMVRNQNMEGVDTVRVLFVPVGTRDTVQVTIEPHERRVDAIAVTSSRFRTADSLGVGALIGKWRAISGVRVFYGDHSDEGVLVVPNHCGVIFRISGGGHVPSDRTTNEAELATWPDTVSIAEIIVSPCIRD